MLKTNKEKLVEYILECKPGAPKTGRGWSVDPDGKPYILPGIGGITINIQAGDSAFGWEGDHVEPGVSCTGNSTKPFNHPNTSLQLLTCVGNKAIIKSGRAKGSEGYVIGQHGGSEHIIVEFPKEVKEEMSYDDKIVIKSVGQGLKLTDFPEIKTFNLDPRLLEKLNLKTDSEGNLEVPVTTLVPAACMGSGVGSTNVASGDYDIMTSDPETVKEYKLDQLKFGDFVAILDHDNSFGRAFRKGSITIGTVVHSDCKLSGHGPGVSTILTSRTGKIKPIIDENANVSKYLETSVKIKEEEDEK